MTEDQKPEELQVDMYVRLPDIVDGPVKRADGVEFKIGDKVRHSEMGVGKVVRVCRYQTVGLALYVEFETGKEKIIGIDFLEQLPSSEKPPPDGGSCE